MQAEPEQLLVDADNGLGSPFGDIDDGFAIAALLKAKANVAALSSTFGNTFEPWAYRNNQALASVLGFSGKLLHGARTHWTKDSPSAEWLAHESKPTRVLALGPLTNVALALNHAPALERFVSEVLITGTNFFLKLPATRFFDFNFSKDPRSARKVFDSALDLVVVPCDVARRLRMSARDLADWPGPLGDYFRRNAARWFWRARLLKASSTVPIWDLVAALFVVKPSLFRVERTVAAITRSGQVCYREGDRPIRVVTDFDPEEVRGFFFSLVSSGRGLASGE